jgi:hypothetical protein
MATGFAVGETLFSAPSGVCRGGRSRATDYVVGETLVWALSGGSSSRRAHFSRKIAGSALSPVAAAARRTLTHNGVRLRQAVVSAHAG